MISIIEYIKQVYKWDVYQISRIPTKYATNSNYLFAYKDKTFFMKIYVSKKAFKNERWFLQNLTSTDNVPELIDFFAGDDEYLPSIILKYYTTYKSLDSSDMVISEDIAFDIGSHLNKVHNGLRKIDFCGKIYEGEHYQSWIEYLKIRMEKMMELFGNHNIMVVRDVYGDILTNLEHIPNVIVPKCIHGDLNPDNILYDSITRNVLIIDYERSYIGHAQMDFCKLFWRCFKFDSQLINSFCKGYGIELDSKLMRLYLNIFLIDILSYLVNLQSPTEEDKDTIFEVINLLGRRNED